jgi:hypothetical protein
MVKLYPVMSVGAVDKAKVESVSKSDFRKKKTPNRFNVSIVDQIKLYFSTKFYL